MKKKLIKVLGIILVFIIIFFIVYKIDTIKRTKERIVNITNNLMNSISSDNYDNIRNSVKNVDGTELSDEQISNFLLNTSLYRATLVSEENQMFTYKANVNFFNTDEGNIIFSFTALNGDIITNEIKYIRNGVHEYLVTDKIQEHNKEKKSYSNELFLANAGFNNDVNISVDNSNAFDGYNIISNIVNEYGFSKMINLMEESSSLPAILDLRYNKIGLVATEDEDVPKIVIASFIKDENDRVYIEVLKEAEEDVKIAMKNSLYKDLDSLKKINEEYSIVWDDEYKIFSLYYGEEIDSLNLFSMKCRMLITATIMQSLEEEKNVNFVINNYDYKTKELIKTETIR